MFGLIPILAQTEEPSFRETISILISRLIYILQHPREARQEAAILLIVLVLIIVFIIVFILLVAAYLEQRRIRRTIKRRVRRRLTTGEIAFRVILATFFVAAIGVGYAYTHYSENFCARCHVPEAALKQHAQAPDHRDVACISCHSAPGITGRIANLAREAHNLAAQFSLVRRTNSVTVFNDACLSCHRDVLDGVVGKVARVKHDDFLNQGYDCYLCHKGTGHRAVEVYTKDYCADCHNGSQATAMNQCEQCHSGDVTLPARDEVEAQSFPKIGTGPVRCNNACHPPEVDATCTPCHGTPMPHSNLFVRRHSVHSWENPALCVRCHADNGATTARACGCHPSDEDSTHGTYERWFIDHRKFALQGSREIACLCHQTSIYKSDICDFCHVEGSPLKRWKMEAAGITPPASQ